MTLGKTRSRLFQGQRLRTVRNSCLRGRRGGLTTKQKQKRKETLAFSAAAVAWQKFSKVSVLVYILCKATIQSTWWEIHQSQKKKRKKKSHYTKHLVRNSPKPKKKIQRKRATIQSTWGKFLHHRGQPLHLGLLFYCTKSSCSHSLSHHSGFTWSSLSPAGEYMEV